jgi:SAM-dependent methyltransferase
MTESPPWHENLEFWESFREYLFPPEKVEEASEQVEKLLALLDLEPGAGVLDVPCGVGRHAVELAERGFRVTGVDATSSYFDAARERAENAEGASVGAKSTSGETKTAGGEVEFVEADMREFRRSEAFDAVLNLYTSFGYFEDREDDERTARNFYESLAPDGALVMSLTSKEVLPGKFEKRTWGEQDGAYVLEEHEVTDDWSWMENRWVVVDDGDATEFTVSHRLYSAFELSELLKRVGFSDVTAYGDLEGAKYDQNAEKLVVVARK